MKSFLDLVREETETHKPVVMAFGRMNPPTTGHLKLIDKVKEMASKYNVALQLLLIVGYVTETDQDHQEQLEWVRKHTHYRNVIQTINVGSTLAILPGTWLHSNQKNLNIRMNSTEVFQDWTREEINSTPEIRMARHQELVDELKINGYNVVVEQDNHVLIESYIRNYHE